MMFWEGYLAPPLKSSYEYSLKEQKTKFSKYVWYFQANLILKNLKLGLAQQIYRRPFTAKLKQSISPVKKRRRFDSFTRQMSSWCNGST